MSSTRTHFSPSRTIFLALTLAIIVGTVLLSFPFSQVHPVSLFDALFTATSSVCVTGLMTIPFDNFSHIGHWIIMFLIQIGGLGMITLTLFVVSLFVNLGFGAQVFVGEMLELDSWALARRMLIFI